MQITIDGRTVVLAGTLDVRCTAELRSALYTVLAGVPDGTDVTVALDAVDSVDLTTLKLIAVANRQAERRGCRVVLRGASPGVRRLLHFSHLRGLLSVAPESSQRPA